MDLIKAGIVVITTSGYLAWGLDSVGRRSVVEQNSSSVNAQVTNDALYNLHNIRPGFGDVYSATSRALERRPRIGVLSFVSTAGGSIATDQTLIAAKASYTGGMEILGIWSDGAETPTWAIEGNAAIDTFTEPAHTANQVETFLKGVYVQGDADNQNVFLDAANCVNLGNAVNYKWYYLYWYET